MKQKTAVIIMICVLAAVLIMLSAAYLSNPLNRDINYLISHVPSFKGTVSAVYDNHISVAVDPDDPIYGQYREILVSRDVTHKDGRTDFSVGDEVYVYYDGNITTDGNKPAVGTVYTILG